MDDEHGEDSVLSLEETTTEPKIVKKKSMGITGALSALMQKKNEEEAGPAAGALVTP